MDKENLSYQEIKDQGAKAAWRLLERQPDPAYLDQWTNLLAKPKEETEKIGTSVIIFRLDHEWLAINSNVFCEVLSYKKVHRIPHRTNNILMGLVNYQGMLRLCVNMHHFLTINQETDSHDPYFRMVSIQKENEQWIFPVNEVYGIFHANIHDLQSPPITVAKSKTSYLKGIIDWNGKNVAYLDEGLLFFGLKRMIL